MLVVIFTRFGRKHERYSADLVNAFGGKVELKDDHKGRYMVLTIHALVDDVQDLVKKFMIIVYQKTLDLRIMGMRQLIDWKICNRLYGKNNIIPRFSAANLQPNFTKIFEIASETL